MQNKTKYIIAAIAAAAFMTAAYYLPGEILISAFSAVLYLIPAAFIVSLVQKEAKT